MSAVSDRSGSPVRRSSSERERLIAEHLGLAQALARRFMRRGEPYEDLVQVASLALIKAADGFDPRREVPFASYAAPTIIGELKHHLRDRSWQVKAPRRLQELFLEVSGCTTQLTQELGRSPTIREIADACARSEDDVVAALEAGRGLRADSLDAISEDSPNFDEAASGKAAPGELFEDADELSSMMASLSPRDQEILRLRFIDELSQSEIAERMSISQMHVSRLLRLAIEDLRDRFRLRD